MLQGPEGCKGNSANSKFKKSFSVEEGELHSNDIKNLNKSIQKNIDMADEIVPAK